MLERLRFDRGLPQRIYCDSGTEFVSAAMDLWAYTNGVALDFGRRGKPTDNAAIESFNGPDRGLAVHAVAPIVVLRYPAFGVTSRAAFGS